VDDASTSIRDAAKSMMHGRFRHLPVVDGAGLVGMVDIADVSRHCSARRPSDLSRRLAADRPPQRPQERSEY
jgi:CBS domain-containing protein